MHVQHLDPEKLFRAYNVDLQVLYPWEGVVEPPFGAAWAILRPGESTKPHQHQEGETFFIVRGQGVMRVGEEKVEVEPGSVVFQDPFDQHTLTNTSPSDDLMFLTVWWEDRELWPVEDEEAGAAADEAAAAEPGTSDLPRRVMVTAAPPTPNGDLHLGHFAGPYLSADFYARYLRLRGVDGRYACGSDDHCMFVERMGEGLGMSGHEAAKYFTDAIEESLRLGGVEMDVFMRPDDSEHFEPLVLDLFDRLYKAGKVEKRVGPSPWCEGCERYLFEADVAGLCPHCASAVTGNTCEACGGVNDCINLAEPRCTKCGETPVARDFKRLVFPLSRYGEALTEYHRKTPMNPHLRSFCERAIADGLPDVAISHFSDWGIRVPVEDDELERQTLYVWFEMAARYFAYARHLVDQSEDGGDHGRYWRSDDAAIVQFFGFDNSFYYTLLLPALYMAYDADLRLPKAFVTNEFYHLDGEKFSTTRDHRILGRDIFTDGRRDLVRFFLAHTCPESEETNFTRAQLEDVVRRELVTGVEGWLRQLGDKARRDCGGVVPATGDWTDEHLAFYRGLERLVAEAEEAYEPATFSPQRLTRILSELARSARRFGRAEDHWRAVPSREQEVRTGLALELLAAKVLAVLALPVMPDFARRLWRDLGFEDLPDRGTWERTPTWVPAGQRLGDLGGEYFSPYASELSESPADKPSVKQTGLSPSMTTG